MLWQALSITGFLSSILFPCCFRPGPTFLLWHSTPLLFWFINATYTQGIWACVHLLLVTPSKWLPNMTVKMMTLCKSVVTLHLNLEYFTYIQRSCMDFFALPYSLVSFKAVITIVLMYAFSKEKKFVLLVIQGKWHLQFTYWWQPEE